MNQLIKILWGSVNPYLKWALFLAVLFIFMGGFFLGQSIGFKQAQESTSDYFRNYMNDSCQCFEFDDRNFFLSEKTHWDADKLI